MRPTLLAMLACAAVACTSPATEDDLGEEGEGGKEDRGGQALPTFAEVDAAHSTAAFRKYVGRALVELRDSPTEIGQLTFQAIVDRRVRIDELVDLTCADYRRALADIPDAGLTQADYAKLQKTNSAAGRKLTAALNGYMWSDRIYVARGLATTDLASTLVHELNHVINHSEAGYYDDLPSSAFREEYRAFYAEQQYDGSRYKNVKLVDYVLDLYELDRAKVKKSLLQKPLTPRLLPDEDAWLDRDLENDPVEPATCD